MSTVKCSIRKNRRAQCAAKEEACVRLGIGPKLFGGFGIVIVAMLVLAGLGIIELGSAKEHSAT